MKILVVEDEKDLNNVITKHLKKNNFSVDSVFDGEEALEYLNYGDYDVIILDIMLPSINGIDILKEIKKKVVFNNEDVFFYSSLKNIGKDELLEFIYKKTNKYKK